MALLYSCAVRPSAGSTLRHERILINAQNGEAQVSDVPAQPSQALQAANAAGAQLPRAVTTKQLQPVRSSTKWLNRLAVKVGTHLMTCPSKLKRTFGLSDENPSERREDDDCQ
jgi:hypothetical protein